uniref:Uncharacterized protein n=1 Tax=Arundo donax TaxID=35708 RepID=A0A0A9E084_ARUDO
MFFIPYSICLVCCCVIGISYYVHTYLF